MNQENDIPPAASPDPHSAAPSLLDLAQKLQASCALQAEVLKAMLRELEEQQARADHRHNHLLKGAETLQSVLKDALDDLP